MPGNLQSVPASVVQAWPAPNYVDPVRRTWLPVYAGILQGVMTAMIATRLWLRSQGKAGALGLDDAMLALGFAGATMFTGLIVYGAENCGIDRHIWDVQPEVIEQTMFIGWLAELAFFVSTCFTKVSVLLFYRRFSDGTYNKRWKYVILGSIIFILAYMLVFVLVLVFNCSPTDAYWKAYSMDYQESYHCTNTTVLNPLSGALSVFTDFYSVVLPVMMLWNLEATRLQKLALNAVFSLGLLVVGAGIARTYYLQKLGEQYDLTWLVFDTYVWADCEVQLAIICASAPALRVFFRRYLSAPLSRALQSTRSVSARSTQRGSNATDMAGFIRIYSRRSRPARPLDDENEIGLKTMRLSVEDIDHAKEPENSSDVSSTVFRQAHARSDEEQMESAAQIAEVGPITGADIEKKHLSTFYLEQ